MALHANSSPSSRLSVHYTSAMPFSFRQGDQPKLDLQVDRGFDFQAWRSQ